MPRYLTPVRICLLELIGLYVSGEIPLNARLGILAFISSQINIPASHDNASLEDRIKLSNSDVTALSNVLSQQQFIVPGRNLYHRLLHSLWALAGLDALFESFNRLKQLTSPPTPDASGNTVPRVSRASPVGVFIRRCSLEFERLQFADVQKLWSAFEAYREPSYSAVSSLNPAALSPLEPHANRLFQKQQQLENAHSNFMSGQDIDVVLSLSISQLQKLGTRVPVDVQSRLREWFNTHGESNAQSLQYFMAFFEHWRAAQMSMALESLHQYFDYSVGANRGSENLKVYFQYAQLHQSVLYADFECWEESVNAMSECIATARENQDTACLNFALSWLLHLRQVHPNDRTTSFENLIKLLGGSSEDDEITFLKTKARESKHWSLLSSTLLEEAKLEMYTSGNVTKAFEHILQSTYLNVQHDQRMLMPAAALFESASFERLGQSMLGYRICQSATFLRGAYAPLGDRVRAGCRISHLFAQTGQYTSAARVLDYLDPHVKGVIKLEERVAAFRALAELKRLIHRDNGPEANELLAEVRPIFAAAGPEVDFEGELLDIQHLVEMKEYNTAMEAVNRKLGELRNSSAADIAQRMHLMILKAKIFAHKENSEPARGFSLALRVAAMAERLQLLPLLAAAINILALVLIERKEFEAARDLVGAALPHALGMPDIQLRAELLSRLADAHSAIAHQMRLQDRPQHESMANMNFAVIYLDRSREAYAWLEDRRGTLLCLAKRWWIARWSKEYVAATEIGQIHAQILHTGETTDVFPKDDDDGSLHI